MTSQQSSASSEISTASTFSTDWVTMIDLDANDPAGQRPRGRTEIKDFGDNEK